MSAKMRRRLVFFFVKPRAESELPWGAGHIFGSLRLHGVVHVHGPVFVSVILIEHLTTAMRDWMACKLTALIRHTSNIVSIQAKCFHVWWEVGTEM